jgi:phospholipid transport system substrate-binding protein
MQTITGIRYGLLVALLAMALPAMPALAESGPREMIVKTVDRLTQRIDADRQKLENDPDYARNVVREELEGLVDFKRITRLVMAEHFDKASKEQKYRFLDVFKDSLINTYSSGLTLYDGQGIRVLPLQEGDVRGNSARVQMEIGTNEGKVIPVFYSLQKDEKLGWQVQNVIVNGLNLGKTFRAQFDQSMQQYNGDIDQVIANWSTELNIDSDDAAAGESADSAG